MSLSIVPDLNVWKLESRAADELAKRERSGGGEARARRNAVQEEGRKEGIWLLDGQLCNLREAWEREREGILKGDGKGGDELRGR